MAAEHKHVIAYSPVLHTHFHVYYYFTQVNPCFYGLYGILDEPFPMLVL